VQLQIIATLVDNSAGRVRRLWRHIWRGSRKVWQRRGGSKFFLKIAWRHLWTTLILVSWRKHWQDF